MAATVTAMAVATAMLRAANSVASANRSDGDVPLAWTRPLVSTAAQSAKADFLYLSRERRLGTPATFRRYGSD